MGFNETWIQLIMLCVETFDYLVLMNGEVGPLFQEKDSNKVTRYHCIYLYCVLKGYFI